MKNNIAIKGTVVEKPQYSHSAHGNKYYKFYVAAKRLSGTADVVCVISPVAIELNVGDTIALFGELRTYSRSSAPHKLLYVYMRGMSVSDVGRDINQVALVASVIREPVYRTTPLGRTVTDIMLEAKRACTGSVYVPCVAWGHIARAARELVVGMEVCISGRLQSREYIKQFEDGTEETRTVYEVSASRIDVVKREDSEDESRS